jgi:hypothetical protein
MPENSNKPVNREEIDRNPDNKIDQDHQGFPKGPANENTISPSTPQEEKTADIEKRDGEKINIRPEDRKSLDEQDSDGSANAFEDK